MVVKYCEHHKQECKHRLVRDLRRNSEYYSCSGRLEEHSRNWRKKNWCKYLANKANKRQRSGSIKLTDLDLQKVWDKQSQQCAVSRRTLDPESKWWKPSLDRIDNSKGYTPDNIRIVAWIINHSRGELTTEEFIDMCKAVAEAK